MLHRAFSKAKKEGCKKVSINFQIPIDLKSEFDLLCKQEGVSVTSMLVALIETLIEESKGIYYNLDANSLLMINNRIDEINKELSKFYWTEGGSFTFRDGISPDEEIYIEKLECERSRLLKIFDMTNLNKED